MHPRLLQNEIHENFSTGSGVWIAFQTGIESLYEESHQDLNDHLIREFNKKIRDLGQPSGLYFIPNDAGLRFLGELSSEPDAGYVFVYASGLQVLLNNSYQVQVPTGYANA